MSRLSLAIERYHSGGVRGLGKELWKFVQLHERISPVLQRFLGRKTHDTLVMAPLLGYWPRIDRPRSFNEKVAHRKHNTDNELFAVLADKWRVRDYVRETVGDHVLNDVYHVTAHPADIPFEALPDEFVLKATHGSGMTRIVDDKTEESVAELVATCRGWLDTDFGERTGEYWYRQIRPRIIVERRIHDDSHYVPPDFKLFVFHGEVQTVEVNRGRYVDHSVVTYDTSWKPVGFETRYPAGDPVEEPPLLEELIAVAETLAKDVEFARVDLYQPNGERVVFGEITLAPGAAYDWFVPKQFDFEMGSYW